MADALNFTKTASRSGVSLPGLTRATRKLEDKLGGPLLYRDDKDTRLSDLGRDAQMEFLLLELDREVVFVIVSGPSNPIGLSQLFAMA